MAEAKKARAVGFNHVALEVGDIEEALAFYGRLFDFKLRGKSGTSAFIDLGDQFLALQKGRTQPADDGRHFGLVVDDKDAVRPFAQFEREVTGERIRDKIAASKKKGMWMGGYPPLGYDVKDRKLIVNEGEAERVRHIFCRYQELGSVRLLKLYLDAEGIVSKRRIAPDGRAYGGKPLTRGALYYMLQNRLYRGEIVHKNQAYPGEHAPIMPTFGRKFRRLWRQTASIVVQARAITI